MDTCSLCQSAIGAHSICNEQHRFCCSGCQAVFQILSAQKISGNPREHPLFQQALRSGIISNPNLLAESRESPLDQDETEKLHLEIQEMWCPSCALLIGWILKKEKGIKQSVVDYCTDLAAIEFYPKAISKEKILRLISQLGYKPVFLQDQRGKAISHSLRLRFVIAAFFSSNIMMFSYPIYASYFHTNTDEYPLLFAWFSLLGTIPVITYCAWPIWLRCWNGLKAGLMGMETLIAIGSLAAMLLSFYELLRNSPYVYFDSLTVIITFVLLGKIIESKAKFSAKDSLLNLFRAFPRRGRKRDQEGHDTFVPIKEIKPGDQVVILGGEKIVLDGVVAEGQGACDESLMTGEALPIFKQKGDRVLAGTLLQQGQLVIQTTAKSDDTALSRMVEMVEQDLSHKSQYIRPIDAIVKLFVPAVLVLAILTFALCLIFGLTDGGATPLQTAVIRFASILLISCPCAIGIAAPLAESHVMNALAKLGAIVRNRGILQELGKETIFGFDKTGTLTEGKFKLLSGLENLSFNQQMLLKGLSSYSNHPIAQAIAGSLLCPAGKFDQIEEVLGRGIKGKIGGSCYAMGSEIFLQENGWPAPEKPENIDTIIYFVQDGKLLSQLHLGDCIRAEALKLMPELAPAQTLLISGDALPAVRYTAEKCQMSGWFARIHPLEKRELIEKWRLEGKVVAMVGDGMNDTPALTAANIGIAVMTASDMSIQVSDILLTTPRLDVLPKIRLIAIKGRTIVKQNLFWAFFYNIIGLGLAAAGLLTPLFAAFAMVISSLIVLFNAQRISKFSNLN